MGSTNSLHHLSNIMFFIVRPKFKLLALDWKHFIFHKREVRFRIGVWERSVRKVFHYSKSGSLSPKMEISDVPEGKPLMLLIITCLLNSESIYLTVCTITLLNLTLCLFYTYIYSWIVSVYYYYYYLRKWFQLHWTCRRDHRNKCITITSVSHCTSLLIISASSLQVVIQLRFMIRYLHTTLDSSTNH